MKRAICTILKVVVVLLALIALIASIFLQNGGNEILKSKYEQKYPITMKQLQVEICEKYINIVPGSTLKGEDTSTYYYNFCYYDEDTGKQKEFSVSEKIYNDHRVGDTITIEVDFRKGKVVSGSQKFLE